jgi:hypothetical protein
MKTTAMLMLLALALTCARDARAKPGTGPTMKDYREAMANTADTDGKVKLQIFLTGVSQGFLVANFTLVHAGKEPLYCQPDKLAIAADTLMNIVETGVKVMEKIGTPSEIEDAPVSMVLYLGMKETFPCKMPKFYDSDEK